MANPPHGFVALKSLKQGAHDRDSALEEIRRIYFTTTRRTIQHDIAHAIELLKSLPTEEDRQKAAVFMDGLSQMRSDWSATKNERDVQTRKSPHRGGQHRKRRKSKE